MAKAQSGGPLQTHTLVHVGGYPECRTEAFPPLKAAKLWPRISRMTSHHSINPAVACPTFGTGQDRVLSYPDSRSWGAVVNKRSAFIEDRNGILWIGTMVPQKPAKSVASFEQAATKIRDFGEGHEFLTLSPCTDYCFEWPP
jgi:hypothetical protein